MVNSYNQICKDLIYVLKLLIYFDTWYNKGKINESKQIYFDLAANYQLTNKYKELITNSLNKFPEDAKGRRICYQNKLKDKNKFNNIEKNEKRNYPNISRCLF